MSEENRITATEVLERQQAYDRETAEQWREAVRPIVTARAATILKALQAWAEREKNRE